MRSNALDYPASRRYAKIALPIYAAVAILAGPSRTPAQLPPGAQVIQITPNQGALRFPQLNDQRQVVYTAFPGGGVGLIYLYEDGDATQIADPAWYNLDPSINNLGVVTWQQGQWDGNYDVVLCDDGIIVPITQTPYPEGDQRINDAGQMAWAAKPCHPASDCREVYFYDQGVISQLTFGSPMRLSHAPELNNNGEIVWLEYDWTFGLFEGTMRIMHYGDGEITQLNQGERHLNAPSLNDLGQVIWCDQMPSPKGAIYLYEDGITTEVLPYGTSIGINNRGDIIFLTEADAGLSWLLRNGVFYQPFEGYAQRQALDINEHGDIVGIGFGWGESPADIFLMVIDPVPGDCDEDGDSDLIDLGCLQRCFTGPGARPLDEACEPFDFDADSDVDLSDYDQFMAGFGGVCALGITTPPNGEGVCVGGSVTLSVDTVGPVTAYQWRKGLGNVTGATGSTYTIDPANTNHNGEYGVRLTGACGDQITSDRRHYLKVQADSPQIRDHPTDQQVCAGEDVRFCTFLEWGSDDYPYDFVYFQWEKDGASLPDSDWSCMFLRDVDAGDEGSYRCRITNACGTTYTSDARLTIVAPTAPPTIIAHPVSVAVGLGQFVEFNVATSCAEATQWQKDGMILPGETNERLRIDNVTCQDAGAYTALLTNNIASVTSDPATLTVNDCP